jgi:hypothetical protein
MSKEEFRPLSVRHGSITRLFGWWVLGMRESLALRLAPWLRPIDWNGCPCDCDVSMDDPDYARLHGDHQREVGRALGHPGYGP